MIMMSKEKSPRNRRYKLLIVIPVVCAVLLFNLQIVEVQAQEKPIEKVVNIVTISGQLFNELNEPLANVKILGGSQDIATASDDKGKFSLLVREDAKLVFFGEGLEKMTIPVAEIMVHVEKTQSGYFTKINMSTTSLMDQNKEITYKGDPIFVRVEEMPEFPGGELECRKFLAKNVKYPRDAHQKGVEGRVFVSFIVNKLGVVDNVHVTKSVEKSLDEEAIRVIQSMPKWKPGKHRGETVNVSYIVPINFGFTDDKKKEDVKADLKMNEDSNGEEVFVFVEEMPEYPGGSLKLKEFYASEVLKLDAKYDIGKRCYVTFLVTKSGEVADARVARSTGNADVDAKALEIVESSVKWKPGKQRGQVVNVSYTVPVNFGLTDDEKE
jgi:TonB family protein